MLIPDAPEPTPVTRISPSLYEDLLSCPAKAAWHTTDDRSSIPPHPAQLLGIAFHRVVEAAHRGALGGGVPDERREAARRAFDEHAVRLYQGTHPLLRVKFSSADRLPYYNQQRELAATLAMETEGPPTGGTGYNGSGGPERWLQSKDGVIFGRPDFIDIRGRKAVDYKTGHADPDKAVSDRERRQLSLYVYLAREEGLDLDSGRIVRSSGEYRDVSITEDDALREADAARAELDAYNAAVADSDFTALATPSADACRLCECKPFCQAFWDTASPEWADIAGAHVQGVVAGSPVAGEVLGVSVLSLTLVSSRGTIQAGRQVVIPQVPKAWFTVDGDREPTEGDVLRLVEGRPASAQTGSEDDGEQPVVVSGDRIASTFWRINEHASESGSCC